MNQEKRTISCDNYYQLAYNNNTIFENNDGTVSAYYTSNGVNIPVVLGSECCSVFGAMSGKTYTFDIDTQECRWRQEKDCDDSVKLYFNSYLNENATPITDVNDISLKQTLSVSFDYLINIECVGGLIVESDESGFLSPCMGGRLLETIELNFFIENITDGEIIYEEIIFPEIGLNNLYNYLQNTSTSGFIITSNDSVLTSLPNPPRMCGGGLSMLYDYLYDQSNANGENNTLEEVKENIGYNAFNSDWMVNEILLSDEELLNSIKNKEIRFGIEIKNECKNICLLINNIKLETLDNKEVVKSVFIEEAPKFEFERVKDNKKSWVENDTLRSYELEVLNTDDFIRETNYNVKDERLILNTKEIDLEMSIANVIENDFIKFLRYNVCLLDNLTDCDQCVSLLEFKEFQDDIPFYFQDDEPYEFMDGELTGNENENGSCCGGDSLDYNRLLEITNINNSERFKKEVFSVLIDVKNRKTIHSYGTLKTLFERYLNSERFCEIKSKALNYELLDKVVKNIGFNWVYLLEQVIPSTTIWDNVIKISNTIFDQQKFVYKQYSSLFCDNTLIGVNVPSPINRVNGLCETIELSVENISSENGEINKCDKICISQMNFGSEFIGNVIIDNETIIPECSNNPFEMLFSSDRNVSDIINTLKNGETISFVNPTCCNCDYYAIMGVTLFPEFTDNNTDNCCVNFVGSRSGYDDYLMDEPNVADFYTSIHGFCFSEGCNSNIGEGSIYEDIQDVNLGFYYPNVFNASTPSGIVEINSGDESLFVHLLDILGTTTQGDKNAFLNFVVNNGIKIDCDGETVTYEIIKNDSEPDECETNPIEMMFNEFSDDDIDTIINQIRDNGLTLPNNTCCSSCGFYGIMNYQQFLTNYPSSNPSCCVNYILQRGSYFNIMERTPAIPDGVFTGGVYVGEGCVDNTLVSNLNTYLNNYPNLSNYGGLIEIGGSPLSGSLLVDLIEYLEDNFQYDDVVKFLNFIMFNGLKIECSSDTETVYSVWDNTIYVPPQSPVVTGCDYYEFIDVIVNGEIKWVGSDEGENETMCVLVPSLNRGISFELTGGLDLDDISSIWLEYSTDGGNTWIDGGFVNKNQPQKLVPVTESRLYRYKFISITNYESYSNNILTVSECGNQPTLNLYHTNSGVGASGNLSSISVSRANTTYFDNVRWLIKKGTNPWENIAENNNMSHTYQMLTTGYYMFTIQGNKNGVWTPIDMNNLIIYNKTT